MHHKRRLGQLRRAGPASHWYATYQSRPLSRRPLSLLPDPPPSRAPVLINIANFGANAGDVLLPVAHRDLISQQLGPVRWQARNVHHLVTRQRVAEMNRSHGVVIGGGGLFLGDTNPNALSGWQWSCSRDALEQIRAPLAVVGVGYNQFRGQEGLSELFTEHVRLLVEKCAFVGLRNGGSVAELRRHLPPELHAKVRRQPCATAVLEQIYPSLLAQLREGDDGGCFVAFNAAFDRAHLRVGPGGEDAYRAVARAARALAPDVEIRYYAHRAEDEAMVAHLEAERVPHTVVRLYGRDPRAVVAAYARPATVVGMRGHAQLIPFGCGRPVVSLVSHDKMRYFLDDVAAGDWGVEMGEDGIEERVVAVVRQQMADLPAAEARVAAAREDLWALTRENMARMAAGFGLGRA